MITWVKKTKGASKSYLNEDNIVDMVLIAALLIKDVWMSKHTNSCAIPASLERNAIPAIITLEIQVSGCPKHEVRGSIYELTTSARKIVEVHQERGECTIHDSWSKG